MRTIDSYEVREAAGKFFNMGLCCSESALLAITQSLKINSSHVPAVASGFCGGMARTGGPCGALTGAIIGIGLALGRATAQESGQAALQATNRLVKEFRELFRDVDCHALIGFDPQGSQADMDVAFSAEGRRDRCARFTCVAAELAANIIQDAMREDQHHSP